MIGECVRESERQAAPEASVTSRRFQAAPSPLGDFGRRLATLASGPTARDLSLIHQSLSHSPALLLTLTLTLSLSHSLPLSNSPSLSLVPLDNFGGRPPRVVEHAEVVHGRDRAWLRIVGFGDQC